MRKFKGRLRTKYGPVKSPILIILAFIFTACALTPVQQGLTNIGARRLAMHYAQENPDKVQDALDLCDQIITTESLDIGKDLLQSAIDEAMFSFASDDPLLRRDIKDILTLLGVDISGGLLKDFSFDLGDVELESLKSTAGAVKEGLLMPALQYDAKKRYRYHLFDECKENC